MALKLVVLHLNLKLVNRKIKQFHKRILINQGQLLYVILMKHRLFCMRFRFQLFRILSVKNHCAYCAKILLIA
jgi:hypothetical protein